MSIVWGLRRLKRVGGMEETEVSVAIAVEDQRVSASATAAEADEQMVIQSSALQGKAAPSAVLIAPWGEVTSGNGTFVIDEESAQLVIESLAAQGTDIPIDYEHQSLGGTYASPTGQAPAAGWIRSLRVVRPGEDGQAEPGLFAEVAWTEAAEAKIVAKEYRYLSPVVVVRKRDRRVVALHSAALTNKPAIAGMKPIVNREEPKGRADPVAAAERSSTGRQEGSKVSPALDEAVELLRLRLGLGAKGDTETVLLAAEDRLAWFMRAAAERDAHEKVAAAMRAGKLTAAQREWAVSLALKDPAAFDDWAVSAPVVVMPGRTEAPTGGGDRVNSRDRAALIASARAEFHSDRTLALLTSESAWICDALREAGLEAQ